MISILMLSWERYETLNKTLKQNLERCNTDYELLICDQGSQDQRVIRLLKETNPTYFRHNSTNEGIPRSFNQLYLRSKGDYIALMSNDILWPENWGPQVIEWLNKVPNSGIASIDWSFWGLPPITKKFGIEAHFLNETLNRAFGPTNLRREVINQIGLFYEGFGNYGVDDCDFNERVNLAGFNSFYIPGLHSEHIGVGAHDTGQYREDKDKSININMAIYNDRQSKRHTEGIREPLPPMKEPL